MQAKPAYSRTCHPRLYGKPAFIRSDDGAEFTAARIMRGLRDASIGPAFITLGSRWQNGFVESFKGKPCDKLPNREWFSAAVPRPRCSSHAGGSSTTSAGPIAHIAINLPPRSVEPGFR
ncbi:hypothetical protein BMMON2_24840 [Burkholderia mallei]